MSQRLDRRFPSFDLDLLRGNGGDALARDAEWECVFAHFQPRLLSYFGRKSEGITPLDDLLQEVWLRAFLNVTSLASSSALWTWLVTIGTNLLRDQLRRTRPDFASLSENPDDDAAVSEFIGLSASDDGGVTDGRVANIREQITTEEWEFLNLLCVDNLTHEEVAHRLGLRSAMASRQRLRRIRQRLTD